MAKDQSDNRIIGLEKKYKFKGRFVPYGNLQNVYSWGGFYIQNLKRSSRSRPLHPGPCPFCCIVYNAKKKGTSLTIAHFEEEEYIIIENHNPIVENQLIFFPRSTYKRPELNYHRVNLIATDVELLINLMKSGFSNLQFECKDKQRSAINSLMESDTLFSQPWAVYINTFPGTGRSVPHLHINCIPASHIPLLSTTLVPWQVCQCKTNNTIISRLANTNFYALTIEGNAPKAIAETLVRFHNAMNEWEIPYNLIAYPLKQNNSQTKNMSVVVVPRDHEYCEAADQKIAGLEFLSGVLIPGVNRTNSMDTIQRDLAFWQSTLKEEPRLKLERRLRDEFEMPPIGMAVYPRSSQDKMLIPYSKYEPVICKNNVFENNDMLKYWKLPQPKDNNDTDVYSRIRSEPNVLVRITRASICQSDRRVLLDTKANELQKVLVLGHEAGGYIVDPGPWENELHADEKVVVLPHITCGHCDACHSYKQHLCVNMKHLGFHIHGNMAELMCFPYQCILPVDENFPDDALPLVEPLSCVIRALFLIKAQLTNCHKSSDPINTFTIYGAGPMGCLAARAVKRFWPYNKVKMVEPIERRRNVVRQNGIAEDIVERITKDEKHILSFVASSKLQAQIDAINATQHGGTIYLFSGITMDDNEYRDRKKHALADFLEEIHRRELYVAREEPLPFTKRCYYLGSSGYGFDDATRSIHELQRHYDHYANIQNVVINGLEANKMLFKNREKEEERNLPHVVEKLLSPHGIYDKDNGELIAETLKVLITL